MIPINASYWAFAFTQSLLMLSAIVALALNLRWYKATWIERPPLRHLILFVALLHGVLAFESTKWVLDRATDPAYAISVSAAILESKSFWEFVPVRAAFLLLAGAQTYTLWRARGLSAVRFLLLAAILAIAAAGATAFHHHQLERYCHGPPGCRLD